MSGSITAGVEVDCLMDAASANGKNCIASLVCSLVDLKPLSAESEHLGHERHAVELTVAVERH
jgi:hypothetical protein